MKPARVWWDDPTDRRSYAVGTVVEVIPLRRFRMFVKVRNDVTGEIKIMAPELLHELTA